MKVIHKSGELNLIEIFVNLFTSSSCNVEVKEENLLDVAIFREAYIENYFDNIYPINSAKKIISQSRIRIGEKGYDIITNNCQHFCNSMRYGKAISQEINDSTFDGIIN